MDKICRLFVSTGQRRIYEPRHDYYWTMQSFKSAEFRKRLQTFASVVSTAPASMAWAPLRVLEPTPRESDLDEFQFLLRLLDDARAERDARQRDFDADGRSVYEAGQRVGYEARMQAMRFPPGQLRDPQVPG